MPLYQATTDGLSFVNEQPFALEREIQNLVEANVETLLGLHFVKSEHVIGDFRIDTLAFDPESKAFVLIEYKRDKNFSVVDQGYAYLAMLLNNKSDFILEYNEKNATPLRKSDVDWSQSRVVFVAPSFTPYQRESVNFKDLPIELWEIKRFTGGIISFAKLQSGKATASIKTVSPTSSVIETVSQEIKRYTEEDHLAGKGEGIAELYQQLRERILELGDVEVQPTKLYIGFVAGKHFTDVSIQRNGVKLWLNMPSGTLNDPLNLARDVSTVGHWGNGQYDLTMKNAENLDYVLTLIRQAYRHNGGE